MEVKIKHLVAHNNIWNWVKSSFCIISAHFLGIKFVFWLKEEKQPACSKLKYSEYGQCKTRTAFWLQQTFF